MAVRRKPSRHPADGAGPLRALAGERYSQVRRFLRILGPGLVTGASDDDPSGIGTYAVAGASTGFSTLWMALATFPLMTAVQVVSVRVGQVTGRGMAGALRQHYPRWLVSGAVLALVVANTINAGVDIGAVAAALNLLVPVPIAAMVAPLAFLLLALQVWGSYRLIASTFKWLTLALLAYVAAAAFAHPDGLAVLRHTFVPSVHLDRDYLSTVVAILGTTISPYLWFWQASQEVEEEVSRGRTTLAQRRGATRREQRNAVLDTAVGMFSSNVVMYFIILTTGATLYAAGNTEIRSAADAAAALRPLAGPAATVLLAVGLVGAGLLAIPVLTGSAAYGVAEAFGWRHGLDRSLRGARQFYAVIAASTLVGMLVNFLGINPIAALFWTAVINGLLAPPVLVLVMLLARNPRAMGDARPGAATVLLGWLTVAAMSAAALAFLFTL